MSLQTQVEDATEERSAFFIGAADSDDVSAEEDHHQLILQKANALSSENCPKEAIDWFSVAMQYGPVRPEQLSTFVDCILRNFKRKAAGPEAPSGRNRDSRGGDVFDCPNCRSFLGEPVTIACGHSYCKRCLQRRLLSKCKLCSEAVGGEEKANVILCGLLDKWFPDELKKSKTLCEVDELCRSKRYQEAVSLATDVIDSDPETAAVARLSRAEAYMALKQYCLALEDTEFCPGSSCSAEALFRKAMVLHEMGQVDESLQVFLHCLAVDEDFPCAKRQVEKILCDLLSPADKNVKVGLRETTQNTSPHLRSKTLVADSQAQSPVQRQHQHQVRAASAHHHLDNQQKRWESLERPGLSRAHSLRMHGSSCGEEGLKRVCSAPQLGDQDKGSLLKRKLSVSDTEPCFVDSGSSKHKKQGVAKGSKQLASKAKTCRSVPENLLDPNDLECSLCMRLFYEPVTTPCGHTFCKNCLERCLDHTPQCPLCKESLKEYLACRKYVVTTVLDMMIKQYLSQEYAERTKTHLEETRELSDLTKNVPIFVCTMAYPTVPCPLHVFEPRYRLMIRRCMDTGTQQFGMCINDPQKGFADYGCMLIIRSVHFLPDGRSVVDTIGGKRFRVLSRGMKDGYSTADIEHLEDTRVEDSDELERLQELHDAVYEQARVWFQNLKIRFHNQILQHFGPMPEQEADIQATPNGPACCWWLLAVLPIDPRYQLSVLSMTSLKERLVKIQHILTYLQSIPSD
ncbi:LON peptidase N-terminal domain and RING finger protein 1 [Seriola lalandi dorsalis]|uniref:LON peptidase N-terminal domain and RING finger protein 1 n=1 Tax=Seriola lalandi dorsalis TaxID=1841481 RepID=UPI000C6FBE57|nr:LON peptidase N-terminal domain and RING finger protein 1 [Seriola lalandi dorsalis]XP_056228297.1 LON peptidase N-terminal domain and ring finger 1, like [Seriola aureovittata]